VYGACICTFVFVIEFYVVPSSKLAARLIINDLLIYLLTLGTVSTDTHHWFARTAVFPPYSCQPLRYVKVGLISLCI